MGLCGTALLHWQMLVSQDRISPVTRWSVRDLSTTIPQSGACTPDGDCNMIGIIARFVEVSPNGCASMGWLWGIR